METLEYLLEAVLGRREGDIIYGTNSSILPSYTVMAGCATYEMEILGMVMDSLSIEVESEFLTASQKSNQKQ